MLRAALLLASLTLPALADEPKKTDVRLVSLELSEGERLDARVRKLGEELVELKPDVVCLQGVWEAGHGQVLLEALAGAKLVHARHGSGTFQGNGVLLASRWPLKEGQVQPFSIAGKPHKPWHGDWWHKKGVAVVALETPAGQVQVAALHLHASHGGEEYLSVQVAQAREAVHALGDHGVRPAPGTPLLVAAALGVGKEALPFRLLVTGSALEQPKPDLGTGWVFVRDGGAVLVRLEKVETVLEKPQELDDGGPALPLSLHSGRLARIELRPLPRGTPAPARPDPRTAFVPVATEAEEAMARARDEAHRQGSSGRAKAVVLLIFAGGFWALARLIAKLKRRKLGCLVALLAMTFIHVATAYAYLGAVYHRQEKIAYEVARQRLEKALEAAKATPPR